MGNDHPIKTKCWLKFLSYKNCKYLRTVASHHQYKCPNCLKAVTVRSNDKDVPGLHVRTILKVMGVSYTDFMSWKNKHC